MNIQSPRIAGALEDLRLKLLDLTGRNRLLNFKHSVGKSLRFVQGDRAAIFTRLVEETGRNSINILGLTEPPRGSWVEKNGRLQRPDPRHWATVTQLPLTYDITPNAENIADANVRALMYPDDLAKHCRKIDREARLAIEETGANMLFIVLGFLEFPDQRNSNNNFLAPLIIVPVSLQKNKSAGVERFSAQYTGDDITENLSLREKIRNDFGLALPELPDDELNIDKYFKGIQKVIKNQPGFAIRNYVSLCLLSFSNMLLVRDLDPRQWPTIRDQNGLLDHTIVREIFEGRRDPGGALAIAEEHDVEEGPNAEIPLVYDADSSQHSALVDVLALQKNIVIEGPPGTGKSQTITNLIAASLSKGDKVLFVAEKLAALQVVKNRLTQAGLDPFVLELHSNKASKKKVLEDIERRINYRPRANNRLSDLKDQLESQRRDLKAYADLINSVAHNRLDLTIHEVIWRAENHRKKVAHCDQQLSPITIQDSSEISGHQLSQRMVLLRNLVDQYETTGGYNADCAHWGFYPAALPPGADVYLQENFEQAVSLGDELTTAVEALVESLGGAVTDVDLRYCETQIGELERLIADAAGHLPFERIPTLFTGDETGETASNILRTFSDRIAEYHRLAPDHNVLVNDNNVSVAEVEALQNLKNLADSMAVVLRKRDDITLLTESLSNFAGSLTATGPIVGEFFRRFQIPFHGSIESLRLT